MLHLVAAHNEKAARQALRMIKVEYEVLKPVLDYKKAIDNESVVHMEDDYINAKFCNTAPERNILSYGRRKCR